MNKVILMGRLTRDAEVRYSQGDASTAVARFTLAVDRRFKRDGDDQTADFINCVAFVRTGEFLGIELGVSVSTQVFSFDIGAILLFLIMSGLQILSMKLPTIIRKRQIKNDYKLNKQEPENQMNSVMTVMIVTILISGFFLPAALAVYWSVGAVFSILQTLVFSSPKVKEKLSALGNRKKKAKVVQ